MIALSSAAALDCVLHWLSNGVLIIDYLYSGSSLLYCLLSLAYPSTASGGAANLSARPKTKAQCSRCCSAQFGGELGSSRSSSNSSSSRSRSSSRGRRSNSSSPNSSSTRRTQVELAQGRKVFNKCEREVLLLLIGKVSKIVVVCLNACSLFFCFGKADNH